MPPPATWVRSRKTPSPPSWRSIVIGNSSSRRQELPDAALEWGAFGENLTIEGLLEAYLNHLRVERALSPADQEVYYREGEMVQAGRPIVSLLPPGNIKVRFFVPQAVLPTVHIGDAVTVRCDGCASDLVARVRFISAQAEFTPPVIYSQEERARLVFRVEAIPERPRDLRVGQPVTVALQTAVGVSHASK